MRPISNERPECLVLENIGQSERARASDGEMMLLKNELVCRRIFELRPNFLKHSQNSHFN